MFITEYDQERAFVEQGADARAEIEKKMVLNAKRKGYSLTQIADLVDISPKQVRDILNANA